MWNILKYIPKNHLSYSVGKLVFLRLPYPLSLLSVNIFSRLFKINLEEAALPLSKYPSIGDFFIRDLKPGLRKIEEGLVSPVDGRLRSYGTIESGKLPQVKGKDYSISDFLGDSE